MSDSRRSAAGESSATADVGVSAEDHLRGLLALTTEAIISVDHEHRILVFNRGAEEMFGYTSAEAIGQSLDLLLPRSAVPTHRAHVQRVMDAGDVSRRMGERGAVLGRRKGGEEFEALVSIGAIRVGGGSVATAVVRDVSPLRAAESALRRSDARHRALVGLNPAGIFACTREGELVEANQALAVMLGAASPSLLHGQSLRQLFVDPHEWDRIVDTVTTSSSYLPSEHRIKRLTGGEVELLMRAVLSDAGDGGHHAIHGFALDVTELRRLEATVRRSEQLDALGKLAGGVAHDFNNLLSVIRICGSFLAEEALLSPTGRRDLEELIRASVRATELTQHLLAYGRRQVLQPQLMDVRTLVERSAGLLSRILGEDVRLDVALCAAPAYVMADEAQLERVLINLVTNARDAMPTGGTVDIRVELGDPEAAVRDAYPDLMPGAHVRLSVRDSGVGMDAATKARVFEPFFTTKGAGRGTGLGLASAYGVVRQSGGQIVVDSELGVGSTFHVFLPARRERRAVARVSPPTPVQAQGFDLPLTVLLVEDEPGVRAVVARVLGARGITVLSAPDGPSALEVLSTHDGSIHALVSDVVMPGMSGQQFADLAAQRRPDIRVLFMSGYSAEAVANHGKLRARSAFIAKPFAPGELLARLAELMSGEGDAPTLAPPCRRPTGIVHDDA